MSWGALGPQLQGVIIGAIVTGVFGIGVALVGILRDWLAWERGKPDRERRAAIAVAKDRREAHELARTLVREGMVSVAAVKTGETMRAEERFGNLVDSLTADWECEAE